MRLRAPAPTRERPYETTKRCLAPLSFVLGPSSFVTYVALLLALLVLAGCGGRSGYTAQQQRVDGLVITLEQPQQVEILKTYELFVTLTDAQGRPVDGAIVFVDLAMPAMPMGAYQPLADALGN